MALRRLLLPLLVSKIVEQTKNTNGQTNCTFCVEKHDLDSLSRQFLHHSILKTTTIESSSIFKTFPCLHPSLATINRTVDSSLGFDWLSRWWEILDRNRAFSASPPGNALFFRRELPAQRPKRWFSLKWERKFLTKLEISQKKGLFVCMDLLCCGSLSQPPRASRKEYKLGLG